MPYTIDYTIDDGLRSNWAVVATFVLTAGSPLGYVSRKYDPPKGFYGGYTVFNNNFVWLHGELCFPQQVIFAWFSPEVQIGSWLYALGGANAQNVLALYNTFIPAVQQGSLQPYAPDPPRAYSCPYDELRITLLDDVDGGVSFATIPPQTVPGGAINYNLLSL